MLFCCLRVTLRLLVINTSSSTPVNNKRRRLPAISVTCEAACIARSGRTIDSMPWRQMLVENRQFCYPTSIRRRFLSEYCHTVWYGKTRMAWIPDGEKNLKICLFILTEFTNVTDTHRQTDIQTPHNDIGRACIASRGKNNRSNYAFHSRSCGRGSAASSLRESCDRPTCAMKWL